MKFCDDFVLFWEGWGGAQRGRWRLGRTLKWYPSCSLGQVVLCSDLILRSLRPSASCSSGLCSAHSPLPPSWSGQALSLGGTDGAVGLEEAGREDFHAVKHPILGAWLAQSVGHVTTDLRVIVQVRLAVEII